MFLREFSFLLLIGAQAFVASCVALFIWLMSAGGLDAFAQTPSDAGWLRAVMVRVGAGLVLSALMTWLTWRFTFLAAQLLKVGMPDSARRVATFCGGLSALATAAGMLQFSLASTFY